VVRSSEDGQDDRATAARARLNALDRKLDEDARVSAMSTLAAFRAQLDGELVNAEASMKAGGESFTPDFLRRFDKLRDQALQDGGTDERARRHLATRMVDLRAEATSRAVQIEGRASARHKVAEAQRTIANVSAVAALDLDRGRAAMAEAEAPLAEMGNQAFAEAVRGDLREGVGKAAVAGLVDRDPVKALELLTRRQTEGKSGEPFVDNLDADSYLQLRRRAEAGAEQSKREAGMTKAQQAADALMQRGLPLDEAMRSVERDFEGNDERLVKAEIANRYAVNEAARKDREFDTYGRAQLEVEQRGRVSPKTWAALTDGHRAAILQRQQAEARQRKAEAEGKPVKTDWPLYLELREQATAEPEKFGKHDLRQFVDRIGGAQLEQLVDLKAGVVKAGEKAPRDAVTLGQQMSASMAALKITRPAAKGQFLSFVQSAVDEATQTKGKPLTFDERQAVIDRAVLEGRDPEAWSITPDWLAGRKRAFELTAEQRSSFQPDAPTDAPATEHAALNEALQAQGLPATPANRIRLYQRASEGRR
jgi:hypothetical protein